LLAAVAVAVVVVLLGLTIMDVVETHMNCMEQVVAVAVKAAQIILPVVRAGLQVILVAFSDQEAPVVLEQLPVLAPAVLVVNPVPRATEQVSVVVAVVGVRVVVQVQLARIPDGLILMERRSNRAVLLAPL
jgi:hypothetical protein